MITASLATTTAAQARAKVIGQPGVKDAVVAYYGIPGAGAGTSVTEVLMQRRVPDDFVQQFTRAFAKFDAAGAQSTVVDGVDFKCGPLSLTKGVACYWVDNDVFGFIATYSDPDAAHALRLATAMHNGGEKPA